MKQVTFGIILALTAQASAFARGGTISSPELHFSSDTPPATIQRTIALLKSDFIFEKGFWVNQFSTQHFSGSIAKLHGLITVLREAGFQVKLRFAVLEADKSTFTLSQNAAHQQQEVTITINTGHKAE